MDRQILYYQKRAHEYDLIYQKEDRQEDLKNIKAYLSRQFHQQSIMEIACGTGYWTEILANRAGSIYAFDINEAVLAIAREKSFPKNNVVFTRKSIESLKSEANDFDGLFGGFIWSHIPTDQLRNFVEIMLNQVRKGGELIR